MWFVLLSVIVVLVCLLVACFWIWNRYKIALSEIEDLNFRNSKLSKYVSLDDLTDAQSRRYLSDRIDRQVRSRTHSLLFVDLDHFKTVNDGYGHEIGDLLLQKIASAMVSTCRPGDFVARMGGDEFCVFLDGCDLDKASQVAERYRAAVEHAVVQVGPNSVQRTATIGVAELRPDQAMVDAIYVADAALYEAKAAGRNRVQAATAEVLQRLEYRKNKPKPEEIAIALNNNEITYFVQPVFDLTTQRAVGVEALIRWVKPDGTVLPPAAFFDVLASNYHRRFQPPLEAANRAATTFTTMDEPLFCSWNISSGFLRRAVGPEQDPEWIDALLMGVDPRLTVFEIIESAVIENPDQTRELLKALRGAGIRVALDDFGTGLSNLERLMEYPVDIVKLDRSFVKRLGEGGDAGVIRAVVEIAARIGADIIAEGVESKADLDALAKVGVTKVQGYYLGRPNSIDYWAERLSRKGSHLGLDVD